MERELEINGYRKYRKVGYGRRDFVFVKISIINLDQRV